jgi:hypothetical protein
MSGIVTADFVVAEPEACGARYERRGGRDMPGDRVIECVRPAHGETGAHRDSLGFTWRRPMTPRRDLVKPLISEQLVAILSRPEVDFSVHKGPRGEGPTVMLGGRPFREIV